MLDFIPIVSYVLKSKPPITYVEILTKLVARFRQLIVLFQGEPINHTRISLDELIITFIKLAFKRQTAFLLLQIRIGFSFHMTCLYLG